MKQSLNKLYLKAALLDSKEQYQDGLISEIEYKTQVALAIERHMINCLDKLLKKYPEFIIKPDPKLMKEIEKLIG